MKQLNNLLHSVIIAMFLSMICLVILQVFLRYVIGFNFSWGEELSRYLFVWTVYLGGMVTVRKGMNITFDVVIDSIPYQWWKIVFTLANIIACGFLIAIAILGLQAVNINMGQASALLRIPMGIVYIAIPLGAVAMLVSQVQYYVENIRERKAEEC